MLSVHRSDFSLYHSSKQQEHMQDDADTFHRRASDRSACYPLCSPHRLRLACAVRYDELPSDLHAFPPQASGGHAFSPMGPMAGYPGSHQYPGPFRSSYTSFPDHHLDQAKLHALANNNYHLADAPMPSYLAPLSIPDSRISSDHGAHSQSPDMSPTSMGGPSSAGHPSMPLSPDQPPTTQGKARTRVYVACLQWCAFLLLCHRARAILRSRQCFQSQPQNSVRRRETHVPQLHAQVERVQVRRSPQASRPRQEARRSSAHSQEKGL